MKEIIQIKGLQRLVQDFPKAKRLAFVDTHATRLRFPLEQWAGEHGDTAPDISVLQPGADSFRVNDWSEVSLVFEAKNSLNADPTNIRSETHIDTLIQLSKNARNMLVAHAALSCCTVGIYNRHMRIFHFDHAAAVASPAFDYIEDPGVLREFLWRFSHPAVGDTVVGADDTRRVPSSAERFSASRTLRALGRSCEDMLRSRWVSVPRADGGKPPEFLTTKVLNLNPRLFSRATTVYEALSTGPDRRLVAVKEAWRQGDGNVRERETAFYEAMSNWFDKHHVDPWGLPRMICGADLGSLETRSRSDVPECPPSPTGSEYSSFAVSLMTPGRVPKYPRRRPMLHRPPDFHCH